MSVRGMYSGGVAADTGGTKLIATIRERVNWMQWKESLEESITQLEYLGAHEGVVEYMARFAVAALDYLTVDEVREIIRNTNAAAGPFSG